MGKLRTRLSKITTIVFILVISSGCLVNIFADGLPGEYYVTQRWRDLLSGHSPATNPAFMTEENYLSTRMALSPTIHNSFILMEFGAILPIGLYHSAGITYVGLFPTEEVAVSEFNESIDDIVFTGDTLNDVQSLFILSYAINPWNRLSMGANVNFFHQTNFDQAINGLSLDLGLSYRLPRHPLLGYNIFGVNLQNLISPDFEFKNLQHEAVNLKVSWLGSFWESRIEAGVDLDIKDIIAQEEQFFENASQGADAVKKIEFDVNSRIGFWILSMLNIYAQFGSDYWGAAFGMNVPTVNVGRDFQVAYQYMSIIDDIDLNSTHTFYFRGDFGKHREEIYARKMAKVASLGPTVLYNQARTFYSQGKYWNAFFIFGKILTEYPDFFKNDWVQLHMGLCQENLDMKEVATEHFLETKKSFPRSEVIYHADLGLLRLHSRDGNSLGVANQFAKLNTSTTPDSLKYHAYYYTGLQHMKDGKFKNAVQLFELIPYSHPEYVFAQFSSAIANATDNNMNDAVIALHNAIQFLPVTEAQKEIINRALTLLGYIFFEGLGDMEPSLSQAVAALRKVPPLSYYYEDAQIGLAWAALRSSNWGDCTKACDEILKTSQKNVLQCEAMLLKGYCAMINKNYQDAVQILTPAYELISKASPPPIKELESAKERFYDTRSYYYEVASMANELAYSGQPSYIVKQIDSLHAPQIEYENKIKDYYKYNDEFTRLSFFNKNFGTLRNDIEYALAKAEKMSGMRRMIKVTEEAGEEIKKIDDKIEMYKEELKKLEKKNEAPEHYEQPPEKNIVPEEQGDLLDESDDIYSDDVFEEQKDSEE